MRASLVLAALSLTGGCYNYSPLTTATLVPGTYVAITLTDAGSQELARYLGPNVFVVRGRYVGDGDQGVLLSVVAVQLVRGDEVPWAGEQVALPNSAIASMQVRQFAKGRSVLLAGVGITGLVATTAAFVLNGGGTPVNGSGVVGGKK